VFIFCLPTYVLHDSAPYFIAILKNNALVVFYGFTCGNALLADDSLAIGRFGLEVKASVKLVNNTKLSLGAFLSCHRLAGLAVLLLPGGKSARKTGLLAFCLFRFVDSFYSIWDALTWTGKN